MKHITRMLCMLLMMALFISLVGCFSSPISVDKDGNVVIKGEDGNGNEVVIGEKKWEKSKMHGLDAPKAKLNISVVADGEAMYGFSEMKEKDAKEYIEKIKAAGFTYKSATIGDYIYSAANKDGLTISFTYDKDTCGGTIIAGKGEPPTEEEEGEGAVLGGTDKKWDSEKMGGLPEPQGTITAYWSANGETTYTFEKIENYLEYVEKIKSLGYTLDQSVAEFNETYIYSASNENGDKVTLSCSDDIASITFFLNQ